MALTTQDLIEELQSKFQSISGNTWLVYDFDDDGKTFGLIVRYTLNMWKLLSYEDSGYSPSQEIISDMQEKQVWLLINSLQSNIF